MTETHARALATAIGGVACRMSGNRWVVHFYHADGRFVIIDGKGARIYEHMTRWATDPSGGQWFMFTQEKEDRADGSG
jgi:hypothetical protein